MLKYIQHFLVFLATFHAPNLFLFDIKERKNFHLNSSLGVLSYDLEMREFVAENKIIVKSFYAFHSVLNIFILVLMIFLSILTHIYIRRNCTFSSNELTFDI